MSDEMPMPPSCALSRRAALAVGGVTTASAALVVTGCATYGPSNAAPAPASQPGAAPSGTDGSAVGAAGAALGPASSVPVGGGRVFSDQQVVVTQPTSGTFRAFSSVCTHAGCSVSSVSGGTINCPCHGSKFSTEDGSVTGGPAKRPLPTRQVTNEGGTLRLT